MFRREVELARYAHILRLGLDTFELDAGAGVVELGPGQRRQEVELPPRARKLAVGHDREADLFLLTDDGADFGILDALELGR
jgi:hypothetical protein